MSALIYSDTLAAVRQSANGAPRVRTIPRRWIAALLIGDLAMFFASAMAATAVVQQHWNHGVNVGHVEVSMLVSVGLWLFVFARLGLYRRSYALGVRDEFYYTVAALCIGVAPQLVLFTIVPSISSSRVTLVLATVFSIVAVGALRATLHAAHDAASRNGRRVVVVGDPSRVDDAVEILSKSENLRVFWIALRDVDKELVGLVDGPRVAMRLGWFRQALLWHADQIVFTEVPSPDVMPHLLVAAAQHGMTLAIAPPRIRAHAYCMDVGQVGPQVLLLPRQLRACRPSARLFKRIFDVVIAGAALLVFSPVMIAIALAMLCLDRSGPMLYRQIRIGRNGRPFEILKFRTMRTDAERDGARFAVKGDARVTRLGRILRRTSLDELPQLFNVLHGDMSVVGPRPERPVFVDQFKHRYPRYAERLLVKPGLTALSHVQMSRVASTEDIGDRLQHDLFYVENWSPLLDLSIIAKTGAEFLFHNAA